MSVGSLGIYGSDGRIRGSYVYMLLCRDAGFIYVKVGMSDVPTKRLAALRVSCPLTPKVFYVVEVHSRDKAKLLEAELLSAFQEWHHNGEWFRIDPKDKASFNEAWRLAFLAHSSTSWKLAWTKIAVGPLAALAKKRKQFIQMTYRRRGKSYQDFRKDLRMAGI